MSINFKKEEKLSSELFRSFLRKLKLTGSEFILTISEKTVKDQGHSFSMVILFYFIFFLHYSRVFWWWYVCFGVLFCGIFGGEEKEGEGVIACY